MERLISDANKLPGVLKDGNDLSVDSFSDVVEAISRVQKEMGISGTTADEAAKTIEGSVGAMKAAWQNWLAGLGNENADMGALSQQLAESIGTALKNIVPRIGAIARGVVSAIPSLFNSLVDLLPAPFQKAVDAVGSVFKNLGNAIAPALAAFTALGMGGIAPLLSKIPLLGGVLGGLAGPLSALGGPIGMVVAAIGTLIATTPELKKAFGDQARALFERFKAELRSMKPVFDKLSETFKATVKQIMPVITDALGTLVPVVGLIMQSLLPLIPTIMEPLMAALERFCRSLVRSCPACCPRWRRCCPRCCQSPVRSSA